MIDILESILSELISNDEEDNKSLLERWIKERKEKYDSLMTEMRKVKEDYMIDFLNSVAKSVEELIKLGHIGTARISLVEYMEDVIYQLEKQQEKK